MILHSSIECLQIGCSISFGVDLQTQIKSWRMGTFYLSLIFFTIPVTEHLLGTHKHSGWKVWSSKQYLGSASEDLYMCELTRKLLGNQADMGILNFRSIKEPVRTKHLLVCQTFKKKLLCAGNELGAAEPGGVKTDVVPCSQEAASLPQWRQTSLK